MSDMAHYIIKGHIKRVVKDPALAEKLTPNYDLGCKRITPSDTYLQVRLSRYSLHEYQQISCWSSSNSEYISFYSAGVQQRLCVSDHHSD